MRWASLLVAVLTVTIVLSGCASSSSSGTAKDAYPAAEAAARAWRSDAQLSAAYSFEATNATDLASGMRAEASSDNATDDADAVSFQADALSRNDQSPGDGKAPIWEFFFTSASAGKSYVVVVDGGSVTRQHEIRGDTSARADIASWKVDSDQASDNAAQANATYDSLRGRPDALAVNVLGFPAVNDTGMPHPIWLLAAGRDHGDFAFVFVDADNGTVLPFPGFNMNFGPFGNFTFPNFGPAELGNDRGRVTAVNPTANAVFSLERRHSRLAVAVSAAPGTLPGQTIQVAVDGPGVHAMLNHTAGIMDTADGVVVNGPGTGTFTYTVTLQNGAAVGIASDYRISWCTDGLLVPTGGNFFGDPYPACGFLQG